ncbi:MAG: hypothetical protein Q7T55_22215 [Solirubrobacteraceae bacterium]|nr:hypothetical protein [Solirubrobacteraceae bacterium]
MSRPRLIGSAFIHRAATTSDRPARSAAAPSHAVEQQRPPRAVTRRIDVAERSVADWTVFTLTPPEPLLPIDGDGGHVLYLHGAVDAPGAHAVHWALLARLAERTGRTITVPVHVGDDADQTLALPAQLLGIYDDLVDDAGDPSAVAVMGDGGGTELAIELIRSTSAEGLPSAQLILLSDDDHAGAAELGHGAVVSSHGHDEFFTERRFSAPAHGRGALQALASSLGEARAAF